MNINSILDLLLTGAVGAILGAIFVLFFKLAERKKRKEKIEEEKILEELKKNKVK